MCRNLFLLLLTFLFVAGCDGGKSGPSDAELDRIALAQKIELVQAKGGLALVIGGETIASDEIIGSLARTNDPDKLKSLTKEQLEEIVVDRISNILLVQHARREAGPNVDDALDKAAESEFRKFVLRFGGNEVKADDELKRLGMDRKSFKEGRRKQLLVDWYLGSQLVDSRPVTRRELADAYEEIKDQYFARDTRITFRLIDIDPGSLQATGSTQDSAKLAEELARKLVERARSGEDFGELAKQHSHGHRKAFGGLWQPVHPEALAPPYNVLATEAEKTEPGQIAGPIAVAGRIFIMKLEAKQTAGYAPFDDPDVQRMVERKVLLNRQDSAQGRLKTRLREEASLGRADEFIDFCLEKIHALSRQPQPDAADRPAAK